MTVKELAQFCKKDERTIQRWVKKSCDKMPSICDKMSDAVEHKITADYTIDEVECILNNSTLPNVVIDGYLSKLKINSTSNVKYKAEPLMTIRDLMAFTGKSERCIRSWISKAKIFTPCEKIAEGVARGYTIDEVECILNNSTMSKDAVAIIMQNARQNKNEIANNNQYVTKDELKDFAKELVSSLMTTIPQIVKETMNIIGPKRQLTLTQDYYSIIAFCKLNNIEITVSEAKEYGKRCVALSKKNNIEIHTVPDERWGKVNSYHVNILNKVILEI